MPNHHPIIRHLFCIHPFSCNSAAKLVVSFHLEKLLDRYLFLFNFCMDIVDHSAWICFTISLWKPRWRVSKLRLLWYISRWRRVEMNAISSSDIAKSKMSIVFLMIFWKLCQTTRSLLCFADSVRALTSITFPKVITPTRPMNIRTIRTNLLPIPIEARMPGQTEHHVWRECHIAKSAELD